MYFTLGPGIEEEEKGNNGKNERKISQAEYSQSLYNACLLTTTTCNACYKLLSLSLPAPKLTLSTPCYVYTIVDRASGGEIGSKAYNIA